MSLMAIGNKATGLGCAIFIGIFVALSPEPLAKCRILAQLVMCIAFLATIVNVAFSVFGSKPGKSLTTQQAAYSAPQQSNQYADDDKHAKFGVPGKKMEGFDMQDVVKILTSPLKAYTLFLTVCFISYHAFGGNLKAIPYYYYEDRIAVISCVLEGYGLIILLHKIMACGHVRGVSGMSMVMFSVTYSLQQFDSFVLSGGEGIAPWDIIDLYCEILQIVSTLTSYVILWTIFSKYRKSYQEDLDVLTVLYLIPGCVVLALVLHPNFTQGYWHSFWWTLALYLHVVALMPQVVMMQRAGGKKIEAPIAHFVAAQAVSLAVDIVSWYLCRNSKGYVHWGFLDWGVVIFFHLFSFALVGDFMYYYFKHRLSGAKMTEDMEIADLAQEV